MLPSDKKNSFLHNTRNKIQLIKLISRKLHSNGIIFIQAEGDADVLIVKTGIEFVKNENKSHSRRTGDGMVLISILVPIGCDLPATPKSLLKVIRCKCKNHVL